jgi:hypothetical protein
MTAKMNMKKADASGKALCDMLSTTSASEAYAHLSPILAERTPFRYLERISAFNIKKSKFFVEEFIDLAAWLDSTLADFNYQGDPTPADIPVPTWTLLAFPETKPLYEDTGKPFDW